MSTIKSGKAASVQRARLGTLKIRVEDHYGRITAYPANHLARKFATIAGTKTLTEDTLLLIQTLGYDIAQTKETEGE